MLEEAFKLQEATFGRFHPSTLHTACNLGVNYKDADRLAEALPLLEEGYQASRTNAELRGNFPPAALLDLYTQLGETAKALALQRKMLAAARARLPQDSPKLGDALAALALSLVQQQQWAEAEAIARECLAIREQAMPNDWRTFNMKSLLGGALLGQNKDAEAEPLLLDGCRGMMAREASLPPQGRLRLQEALARLVNLYQSRGNTSEAAAWQSKLDLARAEQKPPPGNPGQR